MRRRARATRVPADVRHLAAARLARRAVPTAAGARARETRRARRWPGASSLASNSTCRPRQMPRYGVPRAIASRSGAPSGASGAAPRAQSPNAPWPGHDDSSASRTTSGSRVTTHARGADLASSALARPSAGCPSTDVDDRDHRADSVSVPFVDGTAPPRRGSIASRRRTCARERLAQRLDDVVRVAAVVQPHVQVALRAGRERLEELVRQLAVEVADPLAVEPGDAPDEGGRPREVDGRLRQRLVHRQRRSP